jgi:hypothetical protein
VRGRDRAREAADAGAGRHSEECRGYWPRLIDLNPDFVTYRARTTREIPIVVLTPA